MIKIEKNQVFSTEGKYVHKIGTDTYFKRGTTLKSDTIDLFEEIDVLPSYTKEEYDEKVSELVRQKYTESDEFAIQRKAINSTILGEKENLTDEYIQYNAFVEECKLRAKDPDLYGEK